MSSRISTLNLYNNGMRNVMNTNNNLNQITEQLAAGGKKIKSFHSSQNDAQFILNLNREIQLANTYTNNATIVQIRIENMHSNISNILDIAMYLNGELSRSTHSIHDEQLQQMATHKMHEIKHELNTSMGGAYLFSGSMVNIPAIGNIEDIDTYYQGDDVISSAQLSDAFIIQYGITAEHQGFFDLIKCTHLAIATQGNHTTLDQAKSCMEKAIPSLINLQQKVGNDYAMVMRYKQLNEDTKIELTRLRNRVEDSYEMDLPELISEFTLQESVLQASQLMLSKLMNLSLANVLQ